VLCHQSISASGSRSAKPPLPPCPTALLPSCHPAPSVCAVWPWPWSRSRVTGTQPGTNPPTHSPTKQPTNLNDGRVRAHQPTHSPTHPPTHLGEVVILTRIPLGSSTVSSPMMANPWHRHWDRHRHRHRPAAFGSAVESVGRTNNNTPQHHNNNETGPLERGVVYFFIQPGGLGEREVSERRQRERQTERVHLSSSQPSTGQRFLPIPL